MPKKYSEQLRKEIIKRGLSGDSLSDLALQYNIARSTIYKWLQENKPVTSEQITLHELNLIRRKDAKLESEHKIYSDIIQSLNLTNDQKYAAVSSLKEQYSVYTLCRLILLDKSTYLNRIRSESQPKLRMIEDSKLIEEITIIFQKSEFRFGARKIRAKLIEKGYTVSEKRVARLMKERGLKPKKPLRDNATFQRRYLYNPNIVQREFSVDKPNDTWVSDITYVRVCDDTCYLCVVIDLYARKVISFSVSDVADAALVMDAFNKAYSDRGCPTGLVFHSDQGCQYTAYSFRLLLSDYNVRQSFSSPGTPTDNAVAESFYSTIKKELFKFKQYETIDELYDSVQEYVDYYNDYRPHQSLGQQTPNQYESNYYK